MEKEEPKNKKAEEIMIAGVSVAVLEACVESSKILGIEEKKLVDTFMAEFNKILADKDKLMIKAQAFLYRTAEERKQFEEKNKEE